MFSPTGVSTHCAGTSQFLRLTTLFSDSLLIRQNQLDGPTTPTTQRLPAITRNWFGLFRFRSPLLTESRLLSLPVGTEMFHFPTFPPHALCVQAWVTGHDSCRVSPFGKSSDQCSVGSSPRLIAAPYVLLRLLVPRHPPCALINLATKMLASTVQFSRYGRNRHSLTAYTTRVPFDVCRLEPVGDGMLTSHRARGAVITAPSGLNSVPTDPPLVIVRFLPANRLYWGTRTRRCRTGQWFHP